MQVLTCLPKKLQYLKDYQHKKIYNISDDQPGGVVGQGIITRVLFGLVHRDDTDAYSGVLDARPW